jgi:hypothetical protein
VSPSAGVGIGSGSSATESDSIVGAIIISGGDIRAIAAKGSSGAGIGSGHGGGTEG